MKFFLRCVSCGFEFGFKEWFETRKKCPKCGKIHVETNYKTDYKKLKELLADSTKRDTIWYYFDFLPLNNKSNIISAGEGNISIDHWDFLEKIVQDKYNIDCKIYAYKNNENPATHTFKDAGASLAASVLKEHGIDSYIVASTGNVANAYASYLSKANISLSAFVPECAMPINIAGVSYFGQRVFSVRGDYAKAKKVASDYAEKYKIQMTTGNLDPLRVEAKRTMVFEWMRRLPKYPTVYIQALSGGTGPIAIDKAHRELTEQGIENKMPKFIMVQPSGCAPMAEAWQKAVKSNFSDGWQHDYPVYENPDTFVQTLATGNPGSYPVVGALVKKSNGSIIIFDESKCVDVTRAIAFEIQTQIGPASAVAIGGLFDSFKQGLIKNGDVVMVNIGESIERAPEFFEKITYTKVSVDSVDDCEKFDRADIRKQLWDKIL